MRVAGSVWEVGAVTNRHTVSISNYGYLRKNMLFLSIMCIIFSNSY